MKKTYVLCLSLAALLAAAEVPAAAAPESVDYLRDVRPIFADNCFACHGHDPAARKAELRLDGREEALRGGKSGKPAIVPGKAAESELIARVTAPAVKKRMPPSDSGKSLSPAQVETLRRWVDQGAPYAKHWAFIPPARPPLPRVEDRAWARNDIDLFVLSRLEKAGLKPAPEAGGAALLRRLSLDLIGLPPAPAELDAFLSDSSPGAYEREVERLLRSPHYGEKWARHWLDAARYADSDGYEKDLPRKQWAWRDWVIDAFNRDLPYDQFVIEQIAGDLLPEATQDQRVATGFLRNSMVNEEGAILAEQFRMEAMFDRMDCIGKSILGLTIQCAQCHSHKFDPLAQEEYYKLFAFLNDAYEARMWVYSPEQLKTIQGIQRESAELEATLKKDHPGWEERLKAWENEAKKEEIAWEVLDPTDFGEAGGIIHPDKLKDGSILTLGFRPTSIDFYAVASTKLAGMTGLRIEALTHGDLPFGGPGRNDKGTFAISEVTVEASPLASPANRAGVKLKNATADFAQAEGSVEENFKKGADDKRLVGPAGFLIDGKEETAWGVDRGPGRRNQESKAVLQLENLSWPPGGAELKITLKFRHGGADIHGSQSNFLGRVRFSVTSAPNPTADPLPHAVREALHVPREERTASQEAAIFSYWRTTVPELKETNDKIEALWARHPEGETLLCLSQRLPDHARETYLLTRGDWQKPARKIAAGVPAFLHSLPADAPPNRLTFARWLVDRKSPTAARVIVNRVWQTYFGTGLVETAEDFGARASEPSHPELLDWLAVELMERGFSFKELHRLICGSATYRQSSKVTPELLERDPRNRLLARGPRFRVEAEAVRDVALSISGLLNETIGGPSIFPPVPESLFALSFIKVDFWNTATAPDRYRRSLYVFRRRSLPDPVLSSFDAPNGDFACVRRLRSNTPLAALTSLNETVFVAAAQGLALRVLQKGGATDSERAAYAFRLCTSRKPKPAEVDEILGLLNSSMERVAAGWVPAKEVAFGASEKMPELPEGATPTQAAAWTIVARVLLNLDETVTKM
jgi:mono/diheme cytochrome c family protein